MSKIVCKRCKEETERLTGLGVCPECERLISEEVEKEINFINLVSMPLMNLETLLASMKAIVGEASEEIENHLLNLVMMAEEKCKEVWAQLDMEVDGTEMAKKVYESLQEEAT